MRSRFKGVGFLLCWIAGIRVPLWPHIKLSHVFFYFVFTNTISNLLTYLTIILFMRTKKITKKLTNKTKPTLYEVHPPSASSLLQSFFERLKTLHQKAA